jgi:hypothetical protein
MFINVHQFSIDRDSTNILKSKASEASGHGALTDSCMPQKRKCSRLPTSDLLRMCHYLVGGSNQLEKY